MKLLQDFKKFLMQGDIVALAVAIVIGTAFVALVKALVADILTPIIALIFGKPDFSALSFTINSSHFLYGDFLNNVIAFISVAAAVNPKTGGNWEGTGVAPDIQTTAGRARDTAYERALQDVITAGGPAAAEARDALAGVRPAG